MLAYGGVGRESADRCLLSNNLVSQKNAIISMESDKHWIFNRQSYFFECFLYNPLEIEGWNGAP